MLPGAIALLRVRASPGRGTKGYRPDLKESFRAGPESVRSDSYYQRLGADDYFFANIWPAQPTGLRTVWEVYYAVLDRLSREVMAAFALALDLNEQWFDDKIDYAISQLVALHY